MTAPTLDYAPPPGRSRKWILRGLLVLLVGALGYSIWRWGPEAWQRVTILQLQRRCLAYSAPADQVVYEEDPGEAAKLLAQGAGYAPHPLRRGKSSSTTAPVVTAAGYVPASWARLQPKLGPPMAGFSRAYGAIAFLGERTSSSGNRRLVCVRYFPDNDTFTPGFIPGFNCEPIAVIPGTLTTYPRIVTGPYIIDVISSWPRTPPLVRMFAGQPDPNDPARFTIRYQMWGTEDILDGRLLDDDQVTLTPRKVPIER